MTLTFFLLFCVLSIVLRFGVLELLWAKKIESGFPKSVRLFLPPP